MIDTTHATHPDWTVLEDPSFEYLPGELINTNRNHNLCARGGSSLPVLPTLCARGGVAGFMRRDFGRGIVLTERVAMRAPLLVYADAGSRTVHWRARLVPADADPAKKYDGLLHIQADTTQSARHAGLTGAARVDARTLGPLDSRGGWTVGGSVLAHIPLEGFYGFAISGAMAGVRLQWAAMSLTDRT